MNKKLLNSLTRERQEMDSTNKKGKMFHPKYRTLTIVSQPSENDKDVEEFKARLRERDARQKEMASKAEVRKKIQEAKKPLRTKIQINPEKVKVKA